MSLELYKHKRSFKRTPEPTGGKSRKNSLVFVVQKHQASHLHYDFRLELKGVLKSWAVPKGPSMNPEERRLAQLVEDHPFDYKDFEGIIPEGNYGAGTVIIWDAGTYAPEETTGNKEEDERLLTKQFYSGKISLVLNGKKLKGAFTLIKTTARGENAWLLVKTNDRYANTNNISEKDSSVISGLTLEEMAENQNAAQWKSNRSSAQKSFTKKRRQPQKEEIVIELPSTKDYKQTIAFIKRDFKKAQNTAMPSNLKPMLATLTNEPFNNPDWLFEIKWDGFRSLAYLNDEKVELKSRNDLSFNKRYLPVVEALMQWGINAVVDGEIVVLNEEGKPDFQALQNWENNPTGNIAYYLFDILWLDGISLMNEPLEKRKEILGKLVPDSGIVKFSDSIEEYGKDFFDIAKANELEGIVAKEKGSIYIPGKRTKKWLKMPSEIRQEFVIGGWTESENARSFKSLLFGYFQGDKFLYAGHAGGGYKEKDMPQILSRLKKLEIKKQPFEGKVDTDTNTHWVKPELIAEIKFASYTDAGKIRKPAIFLGFRDDKKAEEVKKEIFEIPAEEVEIKPPVDNSKSNWPELLKIKVENKASFSFNGKEVELTNIDKNLWGDFNKANLLTYYHSVYPFIQPHLKDRPLSLHVKHISPTAPGLYIKDMEGHQPPWAELYSMKRKHKAKGKRDIIDYLVCNDEATLQWIINLGCIDVNPWTSRTTNPEYPDYVIIDLDPSDEDFTKAIETAKAAKQFFDKHKIIAFPKTSGKTGIHLYLPCQGFTFPQTRTIAQNICAGIHSLVPSISTTSVSIKGRGNKLYLDPNQNDFADTVAAPYCIRPFTQLQISIPLEWKEINSKLHPSKFSIEVVLERLKEKGDIWRTIDEKKLRGTNSRSLKKFLFA